jgi:hypothetical protein
MYITIKNNLISVYSLKNEIGIDDINIYFNGKQLEDNKTLFEYNIRKNDRVQVVKKNRGGDLTGGQIFGYVILLFVYVGILLTGLIPFTSFVISNILIKVLVIGVKFIKDWTDPNNWLNSFMDVIIEYIIPFFHFIFDFGIISLTIYFLTFACTYELYKCYWGTNVCQSIKNSKTLALFMTMFMIICYGIANLPNFIQRILNPFFPSFLETILIWLINALNWFRSRFINIMPGSGTMIMVVELLTTSIDALSNYSYLIEDSLKNYIVFYKTFMKNKEYEFASKKYGFKTILDLLFRVEKFEIGQYGNKDDPDLDKNDPIFKKHLDPYISRKDDAIIYVTRSIYQSILYVFSKIVYLFDICEVKDEEKDELRKKVDNIGKRLAEIRQYITDENLLKEQGKTENDEGKNIEKMLKESKEIAIFYEKMCEDINKSIENTPSIVVVDCIFKILENGVATAFPMTLLFIIFFLIFMFVPVGF